MKFISLLLSSLLLAACGGGGGGGAPAATNTNVYSIQRALPNAYGTTTPAGFSISGTIGTSTLSGVGSMVGSNGTGTTFAGIPAVQYVQATSGTVRTSAGVSTSINTQVNVFTSADRTKLLGISSPGLHAEFPVAAVLPTSVTVGAAGSLGTMNIYASSAKTALTGTIALSYAITTETPSTALLLLTQVQKNSAGVDLGTQVDTVRLNVASVPSYVSVTATVPGTGVLIFTF